MSVVALHNVGRVYPGGVVALAEASIAIEPGEFVAVVGPSGSGKSTLLNIAGTLDSPTSGEVVIAGHHASSMTDAELSALRAHHIGFVFQQFHLAAGVTALDNVADGLLYCGLSRNDRRARAHESLVQVGLAARAGHKPHQLSGGEKQRVAIARALVGNPSLLLADEPTGALDTASGEVVMQLLHELLGPAKAVVVITHDRELAESLPRQIHLRDGRITDDIRRSAHA